MIYILIIFLIIFLVTLTIYMNKNKELKDRNLFYKILYKIFVTFPKWVLGLFSKDNNDYTSTFKINVEDDNVMPTPSKNTDTHYANSGLYMYDENNKEIDTEDTKIITDPKIITNLHI